VLGQGSYSVEVKDGDKGPLQSGGPVFEWVRVDPIEQFGAKMLDGRLLLTVAHVRVLIGLLVFFA
jgi:hypothetical protein